MAEAQFIPATDPGAASRAGMEAANFTASLYQRKQQQRNDDERLAIAKRQQQVQEEAIRVLMPVKQAQAQADIAGAQAELANAKQMEEQRKAAYSILPSARTEFDELMRITDADKRAEAGLNWVGKYGQLDNLAELNKEFASKKEIAAKLHTEAVGLRMLREQTSANKELIAARGTEAGKVATIRNERLTPIERYKQQRDKAQAEGDDEAVQFYEAIIQKQTAAPISTAEGSDQFQQKLADVEANGSEEEKAFWRARTKAINTRGVKQSGVQALRDALSGTPQATTQTQAPAPKGPTSQAPVRPAPAGVDAISKLQF